MTPARQPHTFARTPVTTNMIRCFGGYSQRSKKCKVCLLLDTCTKATPKKEKVSQKIKHGGTITSVDGDSYQRRTYGSDSHEMHTLYGRGWDSPLRDEGGCGF
jgi:hypothetical protein